MKLYDKRDDFNIPIVIFPFTCSNIPAAPAYGVYISQMIQYSRAGGSFTLAEILLKVALSTDHLIPEPRFI
jgi:hypothetical protein